MNIYKVFKQNIKKNKNCYLNGKIFSYEKILHDADIFANFLINKKIFKLAVISSEIYDYIISYLAISKINSTIIPLNFSANDKQIKLQLKITNPTGVLISKDYEFKKKNYKDFNLIDILSENKLKKNKSEKKRIKNSVNYIITFSSGTTSTPKPIVFSQKLKIKRFLQMKKIYKVKSTDNIFSCSPVDHSMGQRMLFLSLLNGSNFTYLSNYNRKIWIKIFKIRKISFSVLASNYLNLLKKDIINKDIKISKIVSATSNITAQTKFNLIKSKIKFYEMYGASEIGTVTSFEISKKTDKINSVGKVLPTIKINILDENLNCVKNFKVGQITCKTKLKTSGYYKNVNLNKKYFKNGFFLTGDLGYLDNNGYLYFKSRENDLIISSGLNIYPSDIEIELNKHQNIKESAVIGVKDKFFGQVAIAICAKTNSKNMKKEDLDKFLIKNLSSKQLPLKYEFVKKLPRNVMGKINKVELRKEYNNKNLDLSKNLRKILNA